MSSEIFNKALQKFLRGEIKDEQFQGFLEELSSLCCHGDLYDAVYGYQSKVTVPFMRRLHELIYFLLEKGVVPSQRTIDIVCVKGETRLLEDLLKYYDGPLEKEFTHLNLPPPLRMSTVVEVLSGFDIKVRIRLQSGAILSPLEYFIFEYAMGCWSNDSSWTRKFIKDVIRVCPPPNMDMILAIGEARGVRSEWVTEAYNIYEKVKMT